MELNLQRQSIIINETVYDGFVEHPIECDALLPDYCPDIIKVLKCIIDPFVHATTVNGDRLTIEGEAVTHIYYMAEKGAVRHTEYKIPFVKVVELRSAPSHPVILVDSMVDYVNCRAVNQRRVDIRGAITFDVHVSSSKEEQVVNAADGGELQLRLDVVQTTDCIGQYETVFAVTEDLELSNGKAPINTIVRTNCRVMIQDYKVVAGKVVLKGEVLLYILYQPLDENSRLEIMEYALPISQVIDAEGMDEDCIADVKLYPLSCDLQPLQNEDGEYVLFSVDAKIKVMITAYRHREVPIATDCYSILFDCNSKSNVLHFTRAVDTVRETMIHKATLPLPEGIEAVLDAWCTMQSVSCKQDENNVVLPMKMTMSILAEMQDGEVAYFEQESETEHPVAVPAHCKDIVFKPSASVMSCTYNLIGKEEIELRCEVLISGCMFCEVVCNAIHDIALNEENPKEKEANKLYIYYADRGESVWDIAKRYNTSAGVIWEENDLASDKIDEKSMLLIPIV